MLVIEVIEVIVFLCVVGFINMDFILWVGKCISLKMDVFFLFWVMYGYFSCIFLMVKFDNGVIYWDVGVDVYRKENFLKNLL